MANITKINLKGIEYNLTDKEAQNLIAQLRESTYNKTEVDTLVGAIDDKIDAIDMASYAKTADVDTKLATKADKDDTYTKEEVNTLGNQLKAIAEARLPIDSFNQWSATVPTKEEVAAKANASDVYTKAEVDAAVAGVDVSAQLSDYLTKTEAEDTYITPSGLDQVLYDQAGNEGTTFGSVVSDVNDLKDSVKNVYTKTESDGKYQAKGNYLTEHQDISGKANVGDSYTKAESDAKYLTEHQSLADYAKKSEIPTAYDDSALKGRVATLEAIDHSQYLTEHQDISGKVDKVSGKGLSTNDYTAADKAKVDATPTFWVGTQAEYDAIAVKDNKTFYYITEE